MTGTDIHIPTIETERLRLRAPMIDDFEAYAAFRASDRTQFVGGPNTRSEAWQQFTALVGQWHLRGYGRWVVTERDNDTALGVVGLFYPIEWPEPEIAWSMFEAGEGKGYAYEAALAAREYAYGTLGWKTVISCIDPKNIRSAALGKRMGCTPDGVFNDDMLGAISIWRHPSPEAL